MHFCYLTCEFLGWWTFLTSAVFIVLEMCVHFDPNIYIYINLLLLLLTSNFSTKFITVEATVCVLSVLGLTFFNNLPVLEL